MIGVLSAAGSAVANSRALQIGIIGGLFIITFLFWLRARDDQIRKMERMIAERKARLAQENIRKKNNEKSAQVADARASAPSGIDAVSELPDSIRGTLIRD